jgi:sugar lactone lactonase YvrE
VFSPDGERVAVLAPDGTIAIHDALTGLQLSRPLTGARDAVALAWPQTDTLVSGGRAGLTALWDTTLPDPTRIGEHVAYGRTGALAWFNGAYLSVELTPGAELTERSVNGLALAFSPDGETLAIAEATRVRVFDLDLQARGQHFPAAASVTSLAAGPDDRFAYGDASGRAHVWSARTGELATSEPPEPSGAAQAVAFAPDGRTVAAATDLTVRLYRAAASGGLAAGPVLHGHTAAVDAIAFSPDGRIVATAGADTTTRLWSTGTGRALAALPAPGPSSALAFTPDGRTLAAAQAGSVTLYDVATRRRLGDPLPAKRPTGLAFSPDGRTLTAGGLPLEVYRGTAWARDAGAITRRLCALTGRDLTEDERPDGLEDGPCR